MQIEAAIIVIIPNDSPTTSIHGDAFSHAHTNHQNGISYYGRSTIWVINIPSVLLAIGRAYINRL